MELSASTRFLTAAWLLSLPPANVVRYEAICAQTPVSLSPSQKSLRRRRINGRSAEFSLLSACSPSQPSPPRRRRRRLLLAPIRHQRLVRRLQPLRARRRRRRKAAAEPRTALGPSSGRTMKQIKSLFRLPGKPWTLDTPKSKAFLGQMSPSSELFWNLSGNFARPQIAVALAVLFPASLSSSLPLPLLEERRGERRKSRCGGGDDDDGEVGID